MTQGLQLQLGGNSEAETPLTLLLAADHTAAEGGGVILDDRRSLNTLPCSSEKLRDLLPPN